jgi:hypothetical protein
MITITFEKTLIRLSGIDNAADQMKVKRLPGRYYDQTVDAWIVPIRPGLSKALEQVFGFTSAGALCQAREDYFMELIAPPGSVNMWEVSAAVAVELATLYHFYKVHGGDEEHYAKNHIGYSRHE